jgi:hypothetical protein
MPNNLLRITILITFKVFDEPAPVLAERVAGWDLTSCEPLAVIKESVVLK